MSTIKQKPEIPKKPVAPPFLRIINEKVINRKEIDEWDSRRRG